MKITAIGTEVLRLPFPHDGPPLVFAGKPRNGMEMLLVRVDTDEGVTGWGEAFGPGIWSATRATIEALIEPMCIGRDATQIAPLQDELQRKLHSLGRSGSVLYALSGLDIALWDIAAKRAGLPLSRLLDPAARREVHAYASLLRYTQPELVARKSREAIERGYRAVKLHEIGAVETKAAREAIGAEMRLMLDANCPWSVAQAVAIAKELRAVNLHWLEEPVWPPDDYVGLARVRAEGGIAIAAGENAASIGDFEQLIAAGAVDYVQPSITKMGGVTQMLKVFERARSRGVAVAPHSAYFGPGLLATIHVCAAQHEPPPIERYYCDLEASPFGAAIVPVDGRFTVPEKPGLGADPDPNVLRQYRMR